LANSEATRSALLDAAGELFAAQGIEAASLRAIQRAAGVAPGTLQYHFESKDDLLDALIARERAGINKAVVERAERLAVQARAPTPREIIEAIAIPYVEFVDANPVRGPHYIKILAQLVGENDRKIAPLVGQVRTLMPELLARAYPDATQTEARAAIAVAGRSLLFLLAGRGVDQAIGRRAARTAELDAIVRFVAGGLNAMLGRRPKAGVVSLYNSAPGFRRRDTIRRPARRR